MAELDAIIPLTVDGKPRRLSKREAIVRQLYAKALRGNIRAVEIFLEHARKRDAREPRPSVVIEFEQKDPS
jgi:hypothetical protein